MKLDRFHIAKLTIKIIGIGAIHIPHISISLAL